MQPQDTQSKQNLQDEEAQFYQELVKQKVPEFYCDNCEFYPIVPVHGHYECPQCHYKSKCCEGAPANE